MLPHLHGDPTAVFAGARALKAVLGYNMQLMVQLQCAGCLPRSCWLAKLAKGERQDILFASLLWKSVLGFK